MNNILNIFFGVPQSKYAGFTVLVSIVLVSIILFFSPGPSNKYTMFLILFLASLPAIALSLLQLTCIVTGSNKNYWWCNIYAWILTGLIIFYSIYFVVYAVLYYNKSETFATDLISNVDINNVDNTGLISNNIDTNISNYTTSNITNMYEGATNIPTFVKNNSLTFADVLNSR